MKPEFRRNPLPQWGTGERKTSEGAPSTHSGEYVVRAVARADEAGRKVEADEVVLLHDNQRQTAEALRGIIDRYEGSGRRFAGVDELLADKYLDP